MKNGYRYKIDVNSYSSRHYPVALYRFEPKWLWGKWVHQESFATKDEAQKFYDAIVGQLDGLPVHLA